MKMQHIHVVHGQQVDIFLHEVGIEEMSHYVEVHATIAKARTVRNIGGRQQHLFADGVTGQGFTKHLDTIEHSCRRGSADGDALLTDTDTKVFF